MTEQPYPPLRPQPPVRRRSRPTTWPLIAGVVVLAVLVVILAAVLLARGADDGIAASSPTPSASGSAGVEPTGSASGAASPSTGTSPTADAPAFSPDTIVTSTVDALSVRGEPGLDGERLGALDAGAESFVVDGPIDADGFRWYLVSGLGLPPNTGCAGPLETDPYSCPIWFGWAAAASEAGEPWLAETDLDCPQAPLTAEKLGIGHSSIQLLACFGSEPITFRGWWPEIPDDAGLGGACDSQDEPSGWLLCQNINYSVVLADDEEDFFGIGVRISIDPASGASMPERGTWVEVRAHYDDPAAQGCDEAANAVGDPGDPDERIVLICRAEPVLEAVQAVEGP